MKKYFFEIYTSGPKGERGWDISTGTVKAADREDAIRKLKVLYPKFSEVIDLYEIA